MHFPRQTGALRKTTISANKKLDAATYKALTQKIDAMGWSLPSLDDKKMQQALTDKKTLPPQVQSVMKDARQSCERLSKQAITVMKKLNSPESTHHVFLCASSIFFAMACAVAAAAALGLVPTP